MILGANASIGDHVKIVELFGGNCYRIDAIVDVMQNQHHVVGVVVYSADTVRFKIRRHPPLFKCLFVCFCFSVLCILSLLIYDASYVMLSLFLFFFVFYVWPHRLTNDRLYSRVTFFCFVIFLSFVQMRCLRPFDPLQSRTFAIDFCLWTIR